MSLPSCPPSLSSFSPRRHFSTFGVHKNRLADGKVRGRSPEGAETSCVCGWVGPVRVVSFIPFSLKSCRGKISVKNDVQYMSTGRKSPPWERQGGVAKQGKLRFGQVQTNVHPVANKLWWSENLGGSHRYVHEHHVL